MYLTSRDSHSARRSAKLGFLPLVMGFFRAALDDFVSVGIPILLRGHHGGPIGEELPGKGDRYHGGSQYENNEIQESAPCSKKFAAAGDFTDETLESSPSAGFNPSRCSFLSTGTRPSRFPAKSLSMSRSWSGAA